MPLNLYSNKYKDLTQSYSWRSHLPKCKHAIIPLFLITTGCCTAAKFNSWMFSFFRSRSRTFWILVYLPISECLATPLQVLCMTKEILNWSSCNWVVLATCNHEALLHFLGSKNTLNIFEVLFINLLQDRNHKRLIDKKFFYIFLLFLVKNAKSTNYLLYELLIQWANKEVGEANYSLIIGVWFSICNRRIYQNCIFQDWYRDNFVISFNICHMF